MSRLAALRQAVSEFVPLGGLAAWRLQIRLLEELAVPAFPTIRVVAAVPDAATGRMRRIEYGHSVIEMELERSESWVGPREYLLGIIDEFVLHEVRESMGFRPDTRAASATFRYEVVQAASPVVAEVERPFDPHGPDLEKVSLADFRRYARTGRRPGSG